MKQRPTPIGEHHGQAKLTNEQARRIIEMLAEGRPQRRLPASLACQFPTLARSTAVRVGGTFLGRTTSPIIRSPFALEVRKIAAPVSPKTRFGKSFNSRSPVFPIERSRRKLAHHAAANRTEACAFDRPKTLCSTARETKEAPPKCGGISATYTLIAKSLHSPANLHFSSMILNLVLRGTSRRTAT
jgi:hypothetical protein